MECGVGDKSSGRRLNGRAIKEDEIYVPASKRLNSLIGNESPVYATLRKNKEEEERERKRQLAIQERKA
jgi:hypothetical protein